MGFKNAAKDLLQCSHGQILTTTYAGDGAISAIDEKSKIDWYGPLNSSSYICIISYYYSLTAICIIPTFPAITKQIKYSFRLMSNLQPFCLSITKDEKDARQKNEDHTSFLKSAEITLI